MPPPPNPPVPSPPPPPLPAAPPYCYYKCYGYDALGLKTVRLYSDNRDVDYFSKGKCVMGSSVTTTVDGSPQQTTVPGGGYTCGSTGLDDPTFKDKDRNSCADWGLDYNNDGIPDCKESDGAGLGCATGTNSMSCNKWGYTQAEINAVRLACPETCYDAWTAPLTCSAGAACKISPPPPLPSSPPPPPPWTWGRASASEWEAIYKGGNRFKWDPKHGVAPWDGRASNHHNTNYGLGTNVWDVSEADVERPGTEPHQGPSTYQGTHQGSSTAPSTG